MCAGDTDFKYSLHQYPTSLSGNKNGTLYNQVTAQVSVISFFSPPALTSNLTVKQMISKLTTHTFRT